MRKEKVPMAGKKKIEICGHSLSWGTSITPEQIIERAGIIKGLGCGGFELFMNGLGNEFPKEVIAQAAAESELQIVGCAVFTPDDEADPLSEDAGQRAKASELMVKWIDQLSSVGGGLLVGPLCGVLGRPDPAMPTVSQLATCGDLFGEVAKHAKDKGVRIAIEALQWVESPWPITVAETIEFIVSRVEIAGAPRDTVGMLFDIYHALRMEENYLKALEQLLKSGKLFHFHAAGPNRTPPDRRQHIEWAKMMALLKEHNWEGLVSIESFGNQCDLPFAVVGPGNRPEASRVIGKGVLTLNNAGLNQQ
jgi:sugar phosphate isomerase/epimerase